MVTDKDVDRFVADNWELIERIMVAQKGDAERARCKGQKLFDTAYTIVTDPELQKHLITAGIEFIAGLSTIIQSSLMSDRMKEAASGFEKSMKAAACRANEDCPAKAKRVKIVKPVPKEAAE
ncbi:MAG: hypothetical protein J6U12_04690 [Candidatus Methanomethylophilaceae archaeon]|nr:hypothetical protein [Candidatus Methanomethylophilaceae archaeon]MBP5684877.1 hypothetical protein [Candidatus Methanomethylophilaceae archaeon]